VQLTQSSNNLRRYLKLPAAARGSTSTLNGLHYKLLLLGLLLCCCYWGCAAAYCS
jgi:hypothetical protein